jgi:chromosome segregation ATPase
MKQKRPFKHYRVSAQFTTKNDFVTLTVTFFHLLLFSLADEINAISMKIDATKSDFDRKKAHVVNSPGRLKSELAQAEEEANLYREELSKLESDKKASQLRLEVLAKAEKDVQKAIILLTDLENDLEKLKQLNKVIKMKQVDFEKVSSDISELSQQASVLEDVLNTKTTKLLELKKEREARFETVADRAHALRGELQRLQDETTVAREARAAAEAEVAEIEARREQALAEHSAETAEMVAGMKRLQAAVSSYHGRLLRSMADVNATFGNSLNSA